MVVVVSYKKERIWWMVKPANDPHVMLGDLSSDAARPFHPAPVIFHPLRGNLLGRISESERALKSLQSMSE